MAKDTVKYRADNSFLVLLENKLVDLTWRDRDGKTTFLDLTLLAGMPRSSRALQKRGLPRGTLPAFFPYIVAGDLEGLRRVLPEAHWPATRVRTSTLLHLAARHGQLALAQRLVEMGANPNDKIITGREPAPTPLHSVVEGGHADLVRYLLSKGADSKAEAAEKEIPLELAQDDAVFALIEAAAK